MFIKVIGLQKGLHREKTYDYVDAYTFTNSGGPLEDIVYDDGGGDIPYSHLLIEYSKKEPVRISFNTRAYVLTDAGKTIDVLKYDPQKDRKGSISI